MGRKGNDMGFFDDMMPYDPSFDFNNDGHIDAAEFATFMFVMEEEERMMRGDDDEEDDDLLDDDF